MKKASIDIGSNSILLLIAEVDGERRVQSIEDHVEVTGLGRGIDKSKLFSAEAMEESFQVLSDYCLKIKAQGLNPSDIIVTATEAARVVENSTEFFKKLKNELGLIVSIISGEMEAELTTQGSIQSIGKKEVGLLMDIGGASTEFVRFKKKPFNIQHSISLPIGSVRSRDYLSEGSFDQILNNIKTTMPREYHGQRDLLCVAGTMTSLAAMYLDLKNFEPEKINQMVIDSSDFSSFIQDINKNTPSELLSRHPILDKRAATIREGGLLALKLVEHLGIERLHFSTYGLRYGSIIREREELDGCNQF
jgi:exopolyphosphatase/guanosine-5'-triphosphate,3'-diphosphate pyrophosphatase